MIEYIKYKVEYSPEQVYNFKNLKEAVNCKKNIQQEIENGKRDQEIMDRETNIFSEIITRKPASIEEKRKYVIQCLDLLKVYCTPSGIEKREIKLEDDGTECAGMDTKITIESCLREKYTVSMGRRDKKVYIEGGMICSICPWESSGIPLKLELCICPDGGILHRGWNWSGSANAYLHTHVKPEEIDATEAMIDTVNGLFSGRILFEGLKIAVGKTVQDICPINHETEEKKIGKKIYLA